MPEIFGSKLVAFEIGWSNRIIGKKRYVILDYEVCAVRIGLFKKKDFTRGSMGAFECQTKCVVFLLFELIITRSGYRAWTQYIIAFGNFVHNE